MQTDTINHWSILDVDGVSWASRAGVGLVLLSLTGEPIEQSVCLDFSTSNNEAEYEAIIVSLELALTLATSKIETRSDSQLVVGQIQREYEVRDERMVRYLSGMESRLAKLSNWRVKRVPREENEKVNALAEVTATLPITESIMLPVYV